ncbi:MAG: LCP family protein [Acidimicrobiales bacterium]
MASVASRPRPRRTWAERLAVFVGVVLVFACVGTASAIGYVYWKTGRFARAEIALDEVASSQAPRNYLIIGSDSRANIDASDPNADLFLGSEAPSGQRSDTILLVRIDPVAGDIKMLSFPRDLWIPIADDGRNAKINSAYGKGKQVLVDSLRNEFHVEINNYIEVDFRGFKDLVEAVGGVKLYFPTAVKDDHTGLDVPEPGCTMLNGDQGLAFARSRYTQYKRANGTWSDTDPSADLGRIQRQQVFLRTAMEKVASLNIGDLFTFNSLLDVATNSVTIDQTIDRGDMKTLADRFKTVSDEEIKSYALPVRDATSADGQSIVLYDTKKAQPILNIFRGLAEGTVLESDVEVNVKNGSGVKNQARDVLTAFGQLGFAEGSVEADVSPSVPATTVHYAPGSEAAADLVTRHVTGPTQLVADPVLAAGHVQVITGTDFTTLLQTPRAPASTVPSATAPSTTTSTTSSTTGATTTTAPTTTTTAPTTTTTTTIDPYVPGSAPPGVSC